MNSPTVIDIISNSHKIYWNETKHSILLHFLSIWICLSIRNYLKCSCYCRCYCCCIISVVDANSMYFHISIPITCLSDVNAVDVDVVVCYSYSCLRFFFFFFSSLTIIQNVMCASVPNDWKWTHIVWRTACWSVPDYRITLYACIWLYRTICRSVGRMCVSWVSCEQRSDECVHVKKHSLVRTFHSHCKCTRIESFRLQCHLF